MENKYDEIISEVWDIKDAIYADFVKSGEVSFVEFIKKEIAKMPKEQTFSRTVSRR